MSARRRRGDTDAERVIATLHSHGRALVWPTIFLIADAGAASYLFGVFDQSWQKLATVACAVLVALLLWLFPLLLWLARRYTITSRRLVLRRGFFVRTRQELLHSRGYDVSVRKNAIKSVFGSGDILIHTGSDQPLVLRDVPMVNLVQRSLHDLMEGALNPIAARRLGTEGGSMITYESGSDY